jgi:hypothetical protein
MSPFNPIHKKAFGYVAAGTWTALGFSRGIYKYDAEFVHNEPSKPYLYTSRLGYGLLTVFLYINPFFIPSILGKELYRLEVNLRNLSDEKKKPDYYQIM